MFLGEPSKGCRDAEHPHSGTFARKRRVRLCAGIGFKQGETACDRMTKLGYVSKSGKERSLWMNLKTIHRGSELGENIVCLR